MKVVVLAWAMLALALTGACGKRGNPRPPEGAVRPAERTEPVAEEAPTLLDPIEDDQSVPGEPLLTPVE